MLVEAALVIPILVMLMVGMFEITRAIVRFQMVDKAVGSAARYLARVPEVGLSAWGIERARCVATRGVARTEAECDVDANGGKCIVVDWCDATARQTITLDTVADDG